MTHIFISYSKIDTRSLALFLRDKLRELPGVTVWMDESLEAAESWAAQIQLELNRCDYVLVLLSKDVNRPETATRRRSFVLNEIDYAQQLNKPVIPVLVERTLIPLQLAGIQYIDFTHGQQAGVSRLLIDIQRRVGIHPGETTPDAMPVVPHHMPLQPRPRRGAVTIGLVIIFLIVILGAGTLFAVQQGVLRTAPTPVPNLRTQAVLLATQRAIATPDATQTLEALIAQIAADATRTLEAEIVALTQTFIAENATMTPSPLPTATPTADLTQTAALEETLAAIETRSAIEEATQAAQLEEEAVTNTPRPTVTPSPTETATATATATATMTRTATHTPRPDSEGTATAEIVQETRVVEVARATLVANATQDAVLRIAEVESDRNANVREGPGLGFTVVERVEPSALVTIIGEDETGTWYRIRLESGVDGWIFAVLLNPIGTPTPTLTPSPTVEFASAVRLAQAGVGSNDEWRIVYREFDGVTMALVPRGCFTMGNAEIGDDETPTTAICIEAPFWIDRFEVTNQQFADFGGDVPRPSAFDTPNRPREMIRWSEAQSFCEMRGGRLPTEAEWEYAASGPDSLTRPWGSVFQPGNAAYLGTVEDAQTQPVGSFPDGATWVGAVDMVGNVWEWTASLYEPYPYNPADGREEMDNRLPRTIRGGAYNLSYSEMRTTNRDRFAPVNTFSFVGFRCVRDMAAN